MTHIVVTQTYIIAPVLGVWNTKYCFHMAEISCQSSLPFLRFYQKKKTLLPHTCSVRRRFPLGSPACSKLTRRLSVTNWTLFMRSEQFEVARADTAPHPGYKNLKARGKSNSLCGRAHITTRKCRAMGDAAGSLSVTLTVNHVTLKVIQRYRHLRRLPARCCACPR
jgi:hypothetical protein